jgi:hypothetical protein
VSPGAEAEGAGTTGDHCNLCPSFPTGRPGKRKKRSSGFRGRLRAAGTAPEKPQKRRFRHDVENRFFGGEPSVAESFCPMLDGRNGLLYT